MTIEADQELKKGKFKFKIFLENLKMRKNQMFNDCVISDVKEV